MTLEARTIEERLARLEALQEATRDSVQELARRMDRLEGHIDHLGGRIDRLGGRIDHLEGHIDHLEGRIESYFRWLMGTLLVMWVTIIATVVGTLLAALFTR